MHVCYAATRLCCMLSAACSTADDDPVVACPISVTLGYLKGVLPDGVAAAWTGAIVRRAVQLYINRLLALAARQEQQEEVAGEHLVLASSAASRGDGVMCCTSTYQNRSCGGPGMT